MNGEARILVVDDDPGIRRALGRILAPRYEVEAVAGATEAMASLAAAPFDLALVDVRLSDGNGYSLCQSIRERRPETDVILITGSLSEPDEKLYRSLEEGAFYFLFKPFDRRVLLALVERCLRLQGERAAKERHARTLSADLEKARQFQRSLVPQAPLATAGWRLEGRLLSCDALGGDIYLIISPQASDQVICAAADVVGHGVRAAMYAGMLHSTLDAARRRDPEPARLIRELLDGIDFFEAATYATLFYALLQPDGTLRYVNAGHPPPLLQRAGGNPQWGQGPPHEIGGQGPPHEIGRKGPPHEVGGQGPPHEIVPLPATGLPLSKLFRDHSPGVEELIMAPGDRLLVYTDGASEACGPDDAELGPEGLAEVLAACHSSSAAATLDALLARVAAQRGGRPLDDDVTLLLVERG